jgi:FlaA1/EpsC-like NDP-sugar epimerase
MRDKRILITGGAGSIGSELVRQLAPHNKIFILDTNETNTFLLREELKQRGYWVHSRTGDIRDVDVLKDVFEDFKPQVIFHCAALKHVTPNEEYPIEAIKTNILGTYNIIQEAKRWECVEKFVFISTDKVVNATCKMGITKLCAESLVRSEGFTAVRFGNVLESRGSVLEIWKGQSERGEPLTITDERMERYFMTIPEACKLVIDASNNLPGTYILKMPKLNIMQLKEMYYPNAPYSIVGIRTGEALSEQLMTTDEKARAVEKQNYYVI